MPLLLAEANSFHGADFKAAAYFSAEGFDNKAEQQKSEAFLD